MLSRPLFFFFNSALLEGTVDTPLLSSSKYEFGMLKRFSKPNNKYRWGGFSRVGFDGLLAEEEKTAEPQTRTGS